MTAVNLRTGSRPPSPPDSLGRSRVQVTSSCLQRGAGIGRTPRTRCSAHLERLVSSTCAGQSSTRASSPFPTPPYRGLFSRRRPAEITAARAAAHAWAVRFAEPTFFLATPTAAIGVRSAGAADPRPSVDSHDAEQRLACPLHALEGSAVRPLLQDTGGSARLGNAKPMRKIVGEPTIRRPHDFLTASQRAVRQSAGRMRCSRRVAGSWRIKS